VFPNDGHVVWAMFNGPENSGSTKLVSTSENDSTLSLYGSDTDETVLGSTLKDQTQ